MKVHTRRGLVVTISYWKQPADARSSALYSQGGLPNYRLSRVCEFIRLAKSVVPWDGIEPPTRGSSGPRSTAELPGQKKESNHTLPHKLQNPMCMLPTT